MGQNLDPSGNTPHSEAMHSPGRHSEPSISTEPIPITCLKNYWVKNKNTNLLQKYITEKSTEKKHGIQKCLRHQKEYRQKEGKEDQRSDWE